MKDKELLVKPSIIKKPTSPFKIDPYNKRGGKGKGGKGPSVASGGKIKKSIINVRSTKKSGSGGDR